MEGIRQLVLAMVYRVSTLIGPRGIGWLILRHKLSPAATPTSPYHSDVFAT